jgi:hypothetical protein
VRIGVLAIHAIWKSGMATTVLETEFNPDRTILTVVLLQVAKKEVVMKSSDRGKPVIRGKKNHWLFNCQKCLENKSTRCGTWC